MQLRTQQTFDKYVGRIGIAVLRPATMLLGLLLRRDHRLTIGKEVVWVKMLGGGSLLLAMPMLLGFRRANPGVKMVLITTASVKPFAELMDVFDEYRVIDVGGPLRVFRSGLAALLRTRGADCIVDLEVHSKLTTVFTTLTMARNRISFWLEDIFWRRGLASHLVFFNRSSASYHFYDRIGALLGSSIATREECRAALQRATGASPSAERDASQVAVGFACSDLGQERMLSSAQWATVFRDNVRDEHRTFAFLGGPSDRARAQEIIDQIRPRYPSLELLNCCGELSLRQSVSRVFECGEFWGIDSSLLHIARIAGLDCLSYWGPTDPATRLRNTWDIEERVHYRKIACSPCVHTSEEPPCRGDNRCIQGLFGDVAAAPLGWTPIEYPVHRRRAVPQ
ncbi:MAG TPA: glycosyltransferase family 9 protein [Gemmatimonadaceae bacterium]|jgi:ADP-heptose:LPS heptosyltransferase